MSAIVRSRPRVASFGNFTIDRVTTFEGGRSADELGGNCVYAAVGARLWGAPVRTVGIAGRDYPGLWLEQLDSAGIDTSLVRRVPEAHRLIAVMNYDRQGRRENERWRSMNRKGPGVEAAERWRTYSPTIEDAADCRPWADCVHLASMPVDRQNALLRFFAGSAEIITLDLPWSPETMNALDLPDVGLASAVFLSDAELKGHFGKMPPEAAVATLRARGAKLVTIKHGRHGSVTYYENDPVGHRVPAIETQVRDPSGAGDAFCGGFAVGLWESRDPLVAAQYGTVSASFVIEAFGALYAMAVEADSPRDRLSALRGTVSRPN